MIQSRQNRTGQNFVQDTGQKFWKIKNEIEVMSPSFSSYMLRSLVNYPFGAIFQYNFVWKGEFQSTFLCHDCMKTTTHYFVHKSIELSPCVIWLSHSHHRPKGDIICRFLRGLLIFLTSIRRPPHRTTDGTIGSVRAKPLGLSCRAKFWSWMARKKYFMKILNDRLTFYNSHLLTHGSGRKCATRLRAISIQGQKYIFE